MSSTAMYRFAVYFLLYLLHYEENNRKIEEETRHKSCLLAGQRPARARPLALHVHTHDS